jgi:hypothetical protein
MWAAREYHVQTNEPAERLVNLDGETVTALLRYDTLTLHAASDGVETVLDRCLDLLQDLAGDPGSRLADRVRDLRTDAGTAMDELSTEAHYLTGLLDELEADEEAAA